MRKRVSSQNLIITAAILLFVTGATLSTILSHFQQTIGLFSATLISVIAIVRNRKPIVIFSLYLCLVAGILRGAFASAPDSRAPPTVVQQFLSNRITDALDASVSGLASSLLTGDRSNVAFNQTKDFRAAGLSHILAASGYNVTVVASILLVLVRKRLPPHMRLIVIVVGIAVFVICAGNSAAVVRAGIMGGIATISLQRGRASVSRHALLLAAGLLVVLQPSAVVLDIGFQLSFAATIAIVTLVRPLEKKLRRVPGRWGLRQNLSITLSATLGTLPISIWHFGMFSTYSLPANIVAAPLIPFSMATSGAAIVLGGSTAGQIFSNQLELPLKALSWIAATVAGLPFASITLNNRVVSTSIAALGLLMGSFLIIKKRSRKVRLIY